MTYLALYRAWRPQSFRDVTGQRHVIQTIQNSLRQQNISHAYLFSGPRGIGKTSIAKIFAKAINCKEGERDEPCNVCPSCKAITKGELMDVTEIDAASNRGVDEIRDLRDQVKYAPTEVSHKVYIIDEVHMLTNEAFNALLKTLEEPPSQVVFILATTEPHKLPLTIISRCQRYDFHRISSEDIIARLRHICDEMAIEYEEEAFHTIAYTAEGGLRDALSLLDQALVYGNNTLRLENVQGIIGAVNNQVLVNLLESIAAKDVAKALAVFDSAIADGKDSKQLLKDLLNFCRDLLLLRMTPGIHEVKQRGLDNDALIGLSQKFSEQEMIGILEQTTKTEFEARHLNQPRVLVELLLIRLCRDNDPSGTSQIQPNDTHQIQVLQKKIDDLEQRIKQGISIDSSSTKKSAGTRDEGTTKSTSVKRQTAVSVEKLKEIYKNNNQKVYDKIKGHWNDILEGVKKERVTLHAWLTNGEPVAVYQQSIVIAFQNAIHRETADQPANRQLIENVIQKMTTKPFQIETILLNEWNQAIQDTKKTEDPSGVQEECVKKAIELFGEDFVEIKD